VKKKKGKKKGPAFGGLALVPAPAGPLRPGRARREAGGRFPGHLPVGGTSVFVATRRERTTPTYAQPLVLSTRAVKGSVKLSSWRLSRLRQHKVAPGGRRFLHLRRLLEAALGGRRRTKPGGFCVSPRAAARRFSRGGFEAARGGCAGGFAASGLEEVAAVAAGEVDNLKMRDRLALARVRRTTNAQGRRTRDAWL
jgi:hypothetical protein